MQTNNFNSTQMKKILTICLLVFTLLAGGMAMDAKTSKKSTKKTSSTTKNYSPAGHIFRTAGGVVGVEFFHNGTGIISIDYENAAYFNWDSSNGTVSVYPKSSILPNTYFKWGVNGRSLIDKKSGDVYNLVR